MKIMKGQDSIVTTGLPIVGMVVVIVLIILVAIRIWGG